MPRIGQSMSEGTVLEWLVAPGAMVSAGSALLTVETDKTTFEVEAPVDGVLAAPAVTVGMTVEVGTLLGHIEAPSEAAVFSPSALRPPPRSASDAAPRAMPTPATEVTASAAAPASKISPRVLASPKARRLAAEHAIDLATITASGADGVIGAADVLRAVAAAGASTAAPAVPQPAAPVLAPAAMASVPSPAPATPASLSVPLPTPAATRPLHLGRAVRERRPLGSLERVGARRTQAAWTSAPHFVQMVDVDMVEVRRLRAAWKQAGGALTTVTVGDLCVAAAARALAAEPELNAVLDGDERVLFAEVNVGIAVDTPRGLTVPVLRGADRLALEALSARVRELAHAARNGGLGPADFEGGSVTVSNLGAYGIRCGTPVLNAPEAVLVFVGAVEERVVARDGGIQVRPQMTLSVAYDHRVTDGARAARYTARLKDLLERVVPLVDIAQSTT